MRNNKLVQVLAAMDSREVRAFGKYLKALYGRYDAAMALFDHLRANHPALDGPKLDKGAIARKVLPDGGENPEKRVLNEASRLYKWLEEFLILEKLREKDNPAREKMMAEILRERRLSHLFYLKVEAFLERYGNSSPADSWAIIDALYMQHLLYYYSDPKDHQDQAGRRTIMEAMEKAESFFWASVLQYGSEMINRQNILRERHAPRFLEAALKEAGRNQEKYGALHQAFFLAAGLLKKKGEAEYQALKRFFTARHEDFRPEVQQVLQGYLINYAAGRIREGKAGFMEEVFGLYDFGMASGIFFEKGLISSVRFINIIHLACALKKPGWAEAFVEKWHTSLQADVQEETTAVARALVFFERGRFGQVLQLLSGLKHKDPLLEIRVRSLIIMAMEEEGYGQSLILDQIRNFEAYLRRNKVLGKKVAAGVYNFLQALKKYIRGNVDAGALAAEIRSSPEIFFRAWLLRKLGQ